MSVMVYGQQKFTILDSADCAQYITHDTVDHFFKRVQPLEVSILLKDKSWQDSTQMVAANALISAMKAHTASPDKEQYQILENTMTTAVSRSQPYLDAYPLPEIHLGVVKGALYGPSVFYTRENGIYIPEAMIRSGNESTLSQILIHEIFHIQSRNYPGLQEKIYKELGFIKLEKTPEMNPEFQSRTLLNPDGTDWNYAIPLSLQENSHLAYPMIVSKEPSFDAEMPNFFAYLKFQLFPLKQTESGYEVTHETDFDGLPQAWYQPFFDKITQNTQYIIHPDELAADNFVLLTRRKAGEEISLSAAGQDLLNRIEAHYQK